MGLLDYTDIFISEFIICTDGCMQMIVFRPMAYTLMVNLPVAENIPLSTSK